MRSVLVATARPWRWAARSPHRRARIRSPWATPVTVTGPSPFAPGCGGPGEAGPSSVLYENGEVEPSVARQPDEHRQRRRVLAAGPLVGRRRPRPPGGRQHRRRADLDAQRAQVQHLRRRHRQRGRVPARVGPVGVVRPHRDAARDLDLVRQQHAAQRGPGQPLDRRRPDVERPRRAAVRQPAGAGQQLQRQGDITADPTDSRFVYAIWDRLDLAQRATRARGRSSGRSASTGPRGSRAAPTTVRPGSRPARSSTPRRRTRRSPTRSLCCPTGRWSTGSPCSTGTRTPTARAAAAWRSSARTTRARRGTASPRSSTRSRPSASSIPIRTHPAPTRTRRATCPIRTGDIIPDFAVDRSSTGATVRGLAGQPLLGRQP